MDAFIVECLKLAVVFVAGYAYCRIVRVKGGAA